MTRFFQVFCALANSIAAQNYLNATDIVRGGRKVPTDLAGYVEICNNNPGLIICNSNGDYTALDSNGIQVTDTICDATGTIVIKFKNQLTNSNFIEQFSVLQGSW